MATDTEIEDLQIRLSHQEADIQALNLTVARQQTELDILKSELTRLKEQLKELSPSQSNSLMDELPPHY